MNHMRGRERTASPPVKRWMLSASFWCRRCVQSWATKCQDLWCRPGVMSKVLAAGIGLGGAIALAYLAYALVIIVPLLIVAAFALFIYRSIRDVVHM